MVSKSSPSRARATADLADHCLAITEHAPLPMATVEGASHIVRYANPAFCRMMGRPAKRLVGIPLSALLPEKDACLRLVDRVFRNGKPESFVEREESRARPLFWSYTMWPVQADQRLVGVMIQVTETAAFHDRTIAMNEALVLGSVRQHERSEAADTLNGQLQDEISEREKAEKGLQVTRQRLANHTSQLERTVVSRTTALTATNRRLKASVEFVRKGKERYEKLFLESEVMQKKLRQLTHQIISAQEEERKEISRELHDEVVQTLVGINVELSALGKSSAYVDVQTIKDKILHTQQLVENSVNAVHRFARGLRPAVLDDLGLIPALHAHCRGVAAKKKLRIRLTAFGGVEALGGAERTVLFRVAQEALTNVIRHAHATQVKIDISKIPNAIRMEISDNGRAFPVKKILLAQNNKRLGLVGMRERVEMVGGSLAIESAAGQGTTVRAEIPVLSKPLKK